MAERNHIPEMKAYLLIGIIPLLFFSAHAHEVRPVYLEVKQISELEYSFKLKVPARGGTRMNVEVLMPEACDSVQQSRKIKTDDAFVESWIATCRESLEGKNLTIKGIEGTLTDALVRIELLSGNVQTALVRPANPSVTIHKEPSWLEVVKTYFILGVEHILLGIDHLLFVLGLLLITSGKSRILKTVTAFTIAHSITLAMAALGAVHFPGAPVEAVISLSIVFVAYEALRIRASDVAIRKPWVVAFIFGLLHGFGFAGALSETGLPQNSIASALFVFNVGVEVGQIAFIIFVLLLMLALRRMITRLPDWVYKIPPYAIGSLAMFWTIQRVSLF